MLLLPAIFFAACKDENDIGLNVLPPSDLLNTVFTDTSTVISSTELDDSLRTDELSVQLLGSDKDAIFGVTTASVFTQINLEGTPAFGTNPHADSLVLSLAYSGHYGDTSTSQTLNIYRLNEPMYIDSSYYSTRYFNHDSTNALGTITFSPMPSTKTVVGTDTNAVPQIRIRLSQSLADSIIALGGSSTLSSNADWLNYFKGIFIKTNPATTSGAISYLNFFNSKLTLYFHEDTSSVSKNYNFSLTGARLNHFSHDYTGSEVANQLGSTTDSVNYLQALSGVKLKISFPFLKHFLDSGSIQINRAELTIAAEQEDLNSPLPSKLVLVTRNSSGTIVFPIDYFESTGFYGGDLNSTANGYTFNISRQLQRYLDGTVTNADFNLLMSGSGVFANRAIIKSGSNPVSKMKLSISYIKLK